MNYKIYIQSINNFPISDTATSAYLGFKDRGTDIVLFENIEEVPTSKYNVVVGSIEVTNSYFNRFGIPCKKPLNIPDELVKYTKRDIQYMTMGQFKKESKLPIFVKPNRRVKEFVAGVITKEESRRMFFNDIKDDCEVLVSDIIDIESEYRGYVCNKELIGIYWYSGNFRKFINCDIVDKAIKEYSSQPAGYSIDFALTKNGETILIECNDGWSIGNYGLDHSKYAKLLITRWVELFKGY